MAPFPWPFPVLPILPVQVVRHVLSPQDAFILLACDGLFKGLTPAAAVEVVSKAIAAPAAGTYAVVLRARQGWARG